MAVRLTESSVPSDFANASELGEEKYSSDKNYALISYLGSPLRMCKYGARYNIINTYLVFVNTKNVTEPHNYVWQCHFYLGDEAVPFFTSPSQISLNGIFYLDTSELPYRKVLCQDGVSKLIITVTIEGLSEALSLEQYIINSIDDIEELIISDEAGSISIGGRSDVTRICANFFRNYLTNIDSLMEEYVDESLIKLVTAIIYENLIDKPFEFSKQPKGGTDVILECQIDYGMAINTLLRIPLGISQLIPNDVSPLIGFAIEQPDAKIEIINLLRFPKSTIKICIDCLNAIKNNSSDWSNSSWQHILTNKDAITFIVSQFKLRSNVQIKKSIEFAEKVYNIVNTPFIQGILKNRLCSKLRTNFSVKIPIIHDKKIEAFHEDLINATELTGIIYFEEVNMSANYSRLYIFELSLPSLYGGTLYTLKYRDYFDGTGVLSRFKYTVIREKLCKQENNTSDINTAVHDFTNIISDLLELFNKCPEAKTKVNNIGFSEIKSEIEGWISIINTFSLITSENPPIPILPESKDDYPILPGNEDDYQNLNYPMPYRSFYILPDVYPEVLCLNYIDTFKKNHDEILFTPIRLQFDHDKPADTVDYLNHDPDEVLAKQINVTEPDDRDISVRIEYINNIINKSKYPIRIVVRGYADKSNYSGNENYNLLLSVRRAIWFTEYLKKNINEETRKRIANISAEGCNDILAPESPPKYHPCKDVRILLFPDYPEEFKRK